MAINAMGYGLKTLANPSTSVTLMGGQFAVLPSGQYMIMPGKYTFFQFYDPVSLTWRNFQGASQQGIQVVYSDGYNYRLFNPTGTVVGGIVTAGGTSNTALNGIYPAGTAAGTGTVTATTTVGTQGSTAVATATFNVIVGGVVSGTVTKVSGGSGYVLPPIVTFSNPPQGGVAATGYCLLTAGAVSSIVVTNQGAGYTSAPSVTLTNIAGDVGTGASYTAALVTSTSAGNGQMALVTMATNGAGYTSVPTVTVAGGLAGSPAITAVCCFAVTTATTVSSATNRVANQLVYCAQLSAAASTTTNPAWGTGIFQPRNGLGVYNTSSSLATQTILDGGLSQLDVSNLCVSMDSPAAASGTATYASGASGSVTDQSYVIPL